MIFESDFENFWLMSNDDYFSEPHHQGKDHPEATVRIPARTPIDLLGLVHHRRARLDRTSFS